MRCVSTEPAVSRLGKKLKVRIGGGFVTGCVFVSLFVAVVLHVDLVATVANEVLALIYDKGSVGQEISLLQIH